MAETMLEATTPGILFYDAQQRLIRANAQASDLNGLPPDSLRPGMTRADVLELLGAHGEFGPPDEAARPIAERIEQMLADLLADGSKTRLRLLRHRPNGCVLEILTNPMPDGGVVVTLIDATARIMAEEIAGDRAAILDAVMDNARIGVTVFGPDRRVRAQNRMARILSGRPTEVAALGRDHADVVWDIAHTTGHENDPTFRAVIDGGTGRRSHEAVSIH